MSLAVAISSSKYRMKTINPLIRSTLAAVSVESVAMGALASHARQLNLNFGEGKKNQGSPVDLVKTAKKSCVKTLVSDADNFSVPFAAGSSFKDRALLLAATLLIDYRMFEDGAELHDNH